MKPNFNLFFSSPKYDTGTPTWKKKRCPFTKNALMPSGIFSMTRERHGPKEALFWPNLLKLLAESEKFHFQLDIRHYLNSENDLHTHKSTDFKWAYLDDWADIGWHMLASQCNFFFVYIMDNSQKHSRHHNYFSYSQTFHAHVNLDGS